MEEGTLHPGHFMENVLCTEAQTHSSHSDTEVCWPVQSPQICQRGEDVFDRNTNCLVYGESRQPSQRGCVENPPSQPCSCQQNAGNSSQQNGSPRKNSPQSRSRGEQAEQGGAAPLPGAGAASNTRSVSGAGQHMCPQSELTFSPCSTAGQNCPSGEGPSAQQQPWPTRSPAPFMPFPSQPFIFNGAQGAVVPRAWGGPLCAPVQPHTPSMMYTQCCWQSWQPLAYTPPLYPLPPFSNMYPPMGCYAPQCSAMPPAWQPQMMECGMVLRACPYPETQVVPGQSRPTAMQMGPAGVPRGSEQTAAANLCSPGYPMPETMAQNCCTKTDRVQFNEDTTFASREWKKDNMKGNGQSCSYQSPAPPALCSFAARCSEAQTDPTADGPGTRNVEAASSSKASTSKPLSKQGNPESQLFGALNSPRTGEIASCCPCCGQPNVTGQRYCSPCPGHCLINGVCTLHAPPYCSSLASVEQQQRTYFINVPSAALPASLDDRGSQLSPETTSPPNSLQTPGGKSCKMSCGATGQRAEGAKSQRTEETAGDKTEPVSGAKTNSVMPPAADTDFSSLLSKNSPLVQQEDSGARNWSVDVQFDSFSTSRNPSLCDIWYREDSMVEDAMQRMSISSGNGALEAVESAGPDMGRECNEQKTRGSSQPTNRIEFKDSARKPVVKDEAVQKLCDKSIINACISVDRLPEILLKQHGAKEHKTHNNRKGDKTTGADDPCKCRCCCVAQSTPQKQPEDQQPDPNSTLLPSDRDDLSVGTPTCSSYSSCSQAPTPINVRINVQVEPEFRSAEAVNQIKQHLSEALSGMKGFKRQ